MKNRYRIFFILLSLILSISFAGCGQKDQGTADEPEAQSIDLYYLDASEDGFIQVAYTLENSGDPLMAAYEVVYQLSDMEKKHTNRYKASIYEGVVVSSIDLNEEEVTVDFGAGYKQLSPVKEILCRTSIVKSLVQVDGITTVRFTVNGDSLLGSDDVPIGSMDSSTFILEDESEELYNQNQKVTLYYANAKGDGLVACERELETDGNVPIETSVLLALLDEPETEECQIPLPADFTVNQTQIRNNVCYVDLGSEIENLVLGVEEKVTVYAMVNTITALGGASQVQFLINGKKVKNLNDFDSFQTLMTCDYSLCDSE